MKKELLIKLFLRNLPKIVLSVWVIIILKKVVYWVQNFDFSFRSINVGGGIDLIKNEAERKEEIKKQLEKNEELHGKRYLNNGQELTVDLLNNHVKILAENGFGVTLDWWSPRGWGEDEELIISIMNLYSLQTFHQLADVYRLTVQRDLLNDLLKYLNEKEIQQLKHLWGVGLN